MPLHIQRKRETLQELPESVLRGEKSEDKSLESEEEIGRPFIILSLFRCKPVKIGKFSLQTSGKTHRLSVGTTSSSPLCEMEV